MRTGIEPPEQGADVVIPTPKEVVGEITHPRKSGRKRRPDKELLNRLNLKGHELFL
jgi:hypothetical protein